MTKEEILAMKAGRELNIRVAEDVMGCKVMEDEIFGDTESSPLFGGEVPFINPTSNQVFGPLRRYSDDISAAEQVVDKMENYDIRVEFNHYTENWEAEFSEKETDFSYPVAAAANVPEVICKAALLTMLEVKK